MQKLGFECIVCESTEIMATMNNPLKLYKLYILNYYNIKYHFYLSKNTFIDKKN